MILSNRWVWCVSKKTSVNLCYISDIQFKLIKFGLEFHCWWEPQRGRNCNLVPASSLVSSVIQVFLETYTFHIFSKRLGHDMRSRDKYILSSWQKGDLFGRMAQTMPLSSDLHVRVTGIVCIDCAHCFWLPRGQSSLLIAWFFQVHRSDRAVSSSENGFIGFLLPVAVLFFQRARQSGWDKQKWQREDETNEWKQEIAKDYKPFFGIFLENKSWCLPSA